MFNTLKYSKYKGFAFNNVKDAGEYLYSLESTYELLEHGFSPTCVLYSTDEDKLDNMVEAVYDIVKYKNSKIEDTSKQMTVADTYWEEVENGETVYCAELSMNYYGLVYDGKCFTADWDFDVIQEDPEKVARDKREFRKRALLFIIELAVAVTATIILALHFGSLLA